MTVLQELAALYDTRADAEGWPRPGYSTEKIGAEVVLADDGRVVAIRSLLRPDAKGKKMVPRPLKVPAAFKRTSGVKANRLWDKTSYVLGVTAVEAEDGTIVPGEAKRTAQEHQAFVDDQIALIGNATDDGLRALAAFCRTWSPERYAEAGGTPELLDQNVVFTLESHADRTDDDRFVHRREAAFALLAEEKGQGGAPCLVTGATGALATLHPTVKGVAGAQSSGASLVSFNNDAETSHGKKQGENAPTSEAAAFAYGTALNALLARGSGRSMRLGDMTVVFWARHEGQGAEDFLAALIPGMAPATDADGACDEENAANAVTRDRLDALRRGKVPDGTDLDPETRVFVLGLSPNAARLSVRLWHPSTLGGMAWVIRPRSLTR